MKIVIIGPAWPYRGGIAAFTERLAHEFQHEGHEVEVATFTLQYPSFLFPGKTQYSESPAPSDLKISRLVNSINPFNWLSASRKIAAMHPDKLVLMHWLPLMAPCFGSLARLVKRKCGCEVVAVLHNIIHHEPKPLDVWLTRYLVRPIDSFVALSHSVRETLMRFTDAPCHVTPHPLYDHYGMLMNREEASRRLGMNPDKKHLLFFGLIRDYKGLDLLCEAMEQLRDTDVQLMVAGEFYGGEEKYAKWMEMSRRDDEAAKQQDNKDTRKQMDILWHTRFIPDEEVAMYFSAADLVVQPYRTATQSGVTQIAYHFEKPMLVTNVGGLPEIVPHGKCGYVVDVTPVAIADAIRDFAGKENVFFAAGLREEKARYGWDKMTAAIITTPL
ncbi:MAG: glycosyltransferase [Paludibacteraceae bacterium]|nr:glycosyltransferase [Paludibacteraceae bacterium]